MARTSLALVGALCSITFFPFDFFLPSTYLSSPIDLPHQHHGKARHKARQYPVDTTSLARVFLPRCRSLVRCPACRTTMSPRYVAVSAWMECIADMDTLTRIDTLLRASRRISALARACSILRLTIANRPPPPSS